MRLVGMRATSTMDPLFSVDEIGARNISTKVAEEFGARAWALCPHHEKKGGQPPPSRIRRVFSPASFAI